MTLWRITRACALMITAALPMAAGCGGPQPAPPPVRVGTANFDAIKEGMSLVQVEQFMGAWTVASPGIVIKVNGSDKQVDQYRWKRGEKEIVVNFVGDKVVSKSAQGLDSP